MIYTGQKIVYPTSQVQTSFKHDSSPWPPDYFVLQMSRDHTGFTYYLTSTNLPVNGLSPTKCQKVDQLYQIVIAFQKK